MPKGTNDRCLWPDNKAAGSWPEERRRYTSWRDGKRFHHLTWCCVSATGSTLQLLRWLRGQFNSLFLRGLWHMIVGCPLNMLEHSCSRCKKRFHLWRRVCFWRFLKFSVVYICKKSMGWSIMLHACVEAMSNLLIGKFVILGRTYRISVTEFLFNGLCFPGSMSLNPQIRALIVHDIAVENLATVKTKKNLCG